MNRSKYCTELPARPLFYFKIDACVCEFFEYLRKVITFVHTEQKAVINKFQRNCLELFEFYEKDIHDISNN